jgi:hypothetical protein
MRESRVLGAIPAAAAGRGEGGEVRGPRMRRRRRFLSFERLERAIPCVCPASHANLPTSAVKLAPSVGSAADRAPASMVPLATVGIASSANILRPTTFLGVADLVYLHPRDGNKKLGLYAV